MSDGAVRARMELDASGFQQGLAKAGASLNAFAGGQLSHIKGMLAGAFTVGAIGSLAVKAFELGSKFEELSKRTSIGTDSLQRLDYAAKMNGSSVEALTGGLQKLAKARQQAIEGGSSSEAGKAFADLGISIEEVAALTPEQLFYRIADAVKDHNAAVDKAASMTTVLGRSFGELVPMLAEGGKGLKAMADEADRLGIVVNEKAISQLHALERELKTLGAQGTSTFANVLAPALTKYAQLYKSYLSEISQHPSSIGPFGFMGATLGSLLTGEGEAPGLHKNRATVGDVADPQGDKAAKKEAADIERAKEQRAKAEQELARARMNDEQRLADMRKESQALSEEMLGGGATEVKRIELQTKILNIQREIYALQQRMADDAAREDERKWTEAERNSAEIERTAKQDAIARRDIMEGKGVSISAPISDNLARIGGYVGGSGSNALRVAERQEKIQEKMRDYLKKIAERDMTSQQIRDATPN